MWALSYWLSPSNWFAARTDCRHGINLVSRPSLGKELVLNRNQGSPHMLRNLLPPLFGFQTRLRFQMEPKCRVPYWECKEFSRRQQTQRARRDWKLVEMVWSIKPMKTSQLVFFVETRTHPAKNQNKQRDPVDFWLNWPIRRHARAQAASRLNFPALF